MMKIFALFLAVVFLGSVASQVCDASMRITKFLVSDTDRATLNGEIETVVEADLDSTGGYGISANSGDAGGGRILPRLQNNPSVVVSESIEGTGTYAWIYECIDNAEMTLAGDIVTCECANTGEDCRFQITNVAPGGGCEYCCTKPETFPQTEICDSTLASSNCDNPAGTMRFPCPYSLDDTSYCEYTVSSAAKGACPYDVANTGMGGFMNEVTGSDGTGSALLRLNDQCIPGGGGFFPPGLWRKGCCSWPVPYTSCYNNISLLHCIILIILYCPVFQGTWIAGGSCADPLQHAVAVDDPIIYGFDGGFFEFQGKPDTVFSIISDSHFFLNSEFIFDPSTPKGYTWMGDIGARIGDDDLFFGLNGTQKLNGKVLKPSLKMLHGGLLTVWKEAIALQISHYDVFIKRVQDPLHFNVHVDYKFPEDRLLPHGVLGQTADNFMRLPKPKDPKLLQNYIDTHTLLCVGHNAEGCIDGTWEDYTLEELFSHNFTYNRFKGEAIHFRPKDIGPYNFAATHDETEKMFPTGVIGGLPPGNG